MADSSPPAEDHQKRLKLLEAFAHYKTLQEQVAASDRAVVALRDALAAAKEASAELDDHDLQQRQNEAKSADLARITAEKTRADAQAALWPSIRRSRPA